MRSGGAPPFGRDMYRRVALWIMPIMLAMSLSALLWAFGQLESTFLLLRARLIGRGKSRANRNRLLSENAYPQRVCFFIFLKMLQKDWESSHVFFGAKRLHELAKDGNNTSFGICIRTHHLHVLTHGFERLRFPSW